MDQLKAKRVIYCKPTFSYVKTTNSEGPGRGWGTSWEPFWPTLVTKLLQEGPVGTKMGLHASKEGRLETKRGHDGAKVQGWVDPASTLRRPCGVRGDGVGASGG